MGYWRSCSFKNYLNPINCFLVANSLLNLSHKISKVVIGYDTRYLSKEISFKISNYYKSKGIEDKVFYSSLAKAIDIHRSKNFIESEKLYKKLLISYPENYELNRHMGILYQDIGKVEDSFNFFVKCIKKNPNGFPISLWFINSKKDNWRNPFISI